MFLWLSRSTLMSNESGYIPMRRGILDHVERGELCFGEFSALLLLMILADYQTGIAWGCALRLSSICGQGDLSPRYARKLLENLEKKGFIKRFATRRGHGNYPILIHHYECSDGAKKGLRLNATASTNWKNPIYESCLV